MGVLEAELRREVYECMIVVVIRGLTICVQNPLGSSIVSTITSRFTDDVMVNEIEEFFRQYPVQTLEREALLT